MTLMGYTSRTNVENMVGQTFPEIGTTEFNLYLYATERFINNYLGYNAETTTSGLITESVVKEKSIGKIDSYGNMVIDLMHPPIHFDANFNPLISQITYNLGGVSVDLLLTDNTTNPHNTVVDVSENRRKVYYPQLYYLPAISMVTPSAKVNLFGLQDLRFFVTVSYIGGYDSVPEDITLAATYICSEFVLHRKNPQFLQSFTQGSMSQSFTGKSSRSGGLKVSEAFHIGQALLQPYVRYAF